MSGHLWLLLTLLVELILRFATLLKLHLLETAFLTCHYHYVFEGDAAEHADDALDQPLFLQDLPFEFSPVLHSSLFDIVHDKPVFDAIHDLLEELLCLLVTAKVSMVSCLSQVTFQLVDSSVHNLLFSKSLIFSDTMVSRSNYSAMISPWVTLLIYNRMSRLVVLWIVLVVVVTLPKWGTYHPSTLFTLLNS